MGIPQDADSRFLTEDGDYYFDDEDAHSHPFDEGGDYHCFGQRCRLPNFESTVG